MLTERVVVRSSRGLSPGNLELPSSAGFSISDSTGKNVKFRFAGIKPVLNDPPDFIVVVPSTSTTPGLVQIGLNPNIVSYMQPGRIYELEVDFTTIDEDPASSTRVESSDTPYLPSGRRVLGLL